MEFDTSSFHFFIFISHFSFVICHFIIFLISNFSFYPLFHLSLLI